MKINILDLQKYVDDKLIKPQNHPELNLIIWNYTQRCQFEKKWDEITSMCRGLITDPTGEVVARPFNKFFNWDEHESPELPNIPSEKFSAYDKMDGSLGITYPTPNGYALATRGSFTSDQAIKGTQMLHHTEMFKPGMTYLFEIIYPDNRIVIDYSGEEKLIFLGAREIETGKVYTTDWFPDISSVYETPKTILDYSKPRDNAEGVVIHFESGLMVKVKYEEYVRLHRLVTGVTARSVWDLLRTNKVELMGTQEYAIKELVERVPEEFSEWVRNTAKNLVDEFIMCEYTCSNVVEKVKNLESRKDQAIKIMELCKAIPKQGLSGVCFLMLDKRDYVESIWRILRPAHEKPFKKDIDA